MLEAEKKEAPDSEPAAVNISSNAQQQVQSGVSSPAASLQPPATTATEDEDESEDESQILEESPCGRWQKRKEEVGVMIRMMILAMFTSIFLGQWSTWEDEPGATANRRKDTGYIDVGWEQ